MEVRAAAVTVNFADPLIVPMIALIVVVPWVTALASPLLLTVPIAVAEEDHCAEPVRFWVVPLL
jgi:hypothetical protein